MSLSIQEKGQRFLDNLPHCQRLGLSVVGGGENQLTMRLPYAENIIANPLSGALHAEALTTLMVPASGTAVFAGLPGYKFCPTLTFRMTTIKAVPLGGN